MNPVFILVKSPIGSEAEWPTYRYANSEEEPITDSLLERIKRDFPLSIRYYYPFRRQYLTLIQFDL